MSHYTVICPLEGMEQMAQSQWVSTLKKLGHNVDIQNLRPANIDPLKNLPQLIKRITDHKPEAIFVEGAIGFNLPEFYNHADIRQIPVASFWFDDPLRALELHRKDVGYFEVLRLPNVYHFVWDGYWRKWLMDKEKVRSFPIHLAADPEQFYPMPRPSEYKDHVVFIGTLMSPAHIEKLKKNLPLVLQSLATHLVPVIESSAYGTNPYETLESLIQGLPQKLKSAYEELKETKPESILHLHSIAWMLGKNEVRKRILKKALEVSPLLILSGNWESTYCDKKTLREILGEQGERLVLYDTCGMEMNELVKLYSFGKLHLQATDPQSRWGGIPFRVFQTTACRRPLLTDQRKELGECYEYGKEILAFESEKDFSDVLQKALTNSEALEKIAEAGHQRFLKEHTWKHRFDQVKGTLKR